MPGEQSALGERFRAPVPQPPSDRRQVNDRTSKSAQALFVAGREPEFWACA